MANWVEDTVQALKNLGGKAYQEDIYNEVMRIRKVPQPSKYKRTIFITLQEHSSSSTEFKGNDFFRYIGMGTWVLKPEVWKLNFNKKPKEVSNKKNENEIVEWVTEINQAVWNLGGKAHQKKIIEEVARIRKDLPQNHVKFQVSNLLQANITSLSTENQIKYIGNGEWELKDNTSNSIENRPSQLFTKEKSISQDPLFAQEVIRTAEFSSEKEEKLTETEPILKVATKNLEKTPFINKKTQDHPAVKIQLPDKNIKLKETTNESKFFNGQIIEGNNPVPGQFQPLESTEEIENFLQTIKQYREYEDPSLPSWREYIEEVFHILGFTTERLDSRLMKLKIMGAGQNPVAMVIIIMPKENKEEIVKDLTWVSYLFYAAVYHQIPWMVLTDGIEIKVFQIQGNQLNVALDWLDLDETVVNSWYESFYKIFRVFAFIRNGSAAKLMEETINDPDLSGEDIGTLRIRFWEKLQDKLIKSKMIGTKRKLRSENWFSISAGRTGFSYAFTIKKNDADVHLYIDLGHVNRNKAFFDNLFNDKNEIERTLNKRLDWQRLDTKRACRIRYIFQNRGILDVDNWDSLQEDMMQLVAEFKNIFGPYVAESKKFKYVGRW